MANIRPLHLFAALCLVMIWGGNFVFIKIGLRDIPPIFFSFLRFMFAAFPAVFFFKRPSISFWYIFLYGFFLFALQFSFLSCGLYLGVSAGLASLVVQVHVFFTIGLAAIFFRERPTLSQIMGALVAFFGIIIIALHLGEEVTLLGLSYILLAALSWGIGNVLTKRFREADVLALVVWGSLMAAPSLLILSLLFEGPSSILLSLTHMSWHAMGAVAYAVYLATLMGYMIWNQLIALYPTATVAPLTLLVPVIGMATSAWIMGEQLQAFKLFSALLVIGGLCLHLCGPRIEAYIKERIERST